MFFIAVIRNVTWACSDCLRLAGRVTARRRLIRSCPVALVLPFCFPYPAKAGDGLAMIRWKWSQFDALCRRDCAVAVYGGRFVETWTTKVFGISGYTPIWNWRWGKSSIVAIAVSRRIASISLGSWVDVIDFEPELGVGKRFGNMRETEFWAVWTTRWKKFPWNDIVYTTVSLSTGLSYATSVSPIERSRDGRGKGSRLLHFFAPEITFALPNRRSLELVFRYHHRSGTYSTFGLEWLFHGVDTDTSYATIGLRYRF